MKMRSACRTCCRIGARSAAIGMAALFAAASALGMHPKIEFDETVHEADVIFVGRVEEMTSRFTEGQKSIVTDVSFRVIDLVHQKPGTPAVGPVLLLTHAGGAVGGISMSVSGQPHFDQGAEYLLFAFNDGEVYMNPLVGGPQGLFKITRDERTGQAYPLAPGGGGIAAIQNGRMSVTAPVRSIEGGMVEFAQAAPQAAPEPGRAGDAAAGVERPEHVMTLEEVKGAIRAQLAVPMDRPARLRRSGAVDPASIDLPGKVPANGAAAAQRAAAEIPVAPKEDRADLAEIRAMGVRLPAPSGEGEGMEMEETIDGDRATLCGCGYFDLFLTMEQVPTTWTSWQFNNDTMYRYNQFMDIYRYVADDGSFGDNSENEFCGWVSNATYMSVYGFSWGGALAATVTWAPSGCPCCEISQADVLFNPAYSWTYNFASAFNQTPINYQPVLIHELGHTWGLQRGSCTEDYSYSRATVMHAYYDNVVEDGFGLHSWDAYAMRELYDDQTGIPGIIDIGVESYIASGSLVNADTNGDTVFRPGDSITVRNLTVENMSNSAISNLRLRLYLSSNNTISTGDHQMGSYWNWSSFSAEGFYEGNFTTTVPNVPAGTYYVGAIVTRNGANYDYDDYTSNNFIWLPNTISIIPPLPSNDESEDAFNVGLGNHAIDTSGATTDGFANATCNAGYGHAYNDVWYRYTPECDGTLTASTCNQATFDTVIVIYRDNGSHPPGASLRIGCNDDTSGCGLTSRVAVTVTAGQPYLIRVGGYDSLDRGTGTLSLTFVANLPNNPCSGSILIAAGSHDFNTNCATTDGVANPSCQFDGQVYNDIWYRYVATCTGNLTVSTCNQADYDTDLAVYRHTGTCPPSNANMLGCNDDAFGCSGYSSRVTVPVQNGLTYLIRVGGYVASSAGTGTLSLSIACAPPVCGGDANNDGAVTFADVTSVLEFWGFAYSPGANGLGDANDDGIVSFADVTNVLQNFGLPCT